MIDTETAHAKINLALHVRGREANGYHRIETLFAFCEGGDTLTLRPRDQGVSLTVGGPFAGSLGGDGDNLVLAAARWMMRTASLADRKLPGVAFHLYKRLPVAAGLGGGSADAGAAIRLLRRYWLADEGLEEPGIGAAVLGADVPACILSATRLGTGMGADLSLPEDDDAAGLPVLLVNPGVPLATGPVFGAWDGVDRGPLPGGRVMEAASAGRNDLEVPAIRLCPPIGDVLDMLSAQAGATLVRMSGSGATCFALFEHADARDAAEAAVAAARPGWWTLASTLR